LAPCWRTNRRDSQNRRRRNPRNREDRRRRLYLRSRASRIIRT
jgi:hypothetical protein